MSSAGETDRAPGQVFAAVAHPVRRRVVEILHARSMTVSELADQFSIGRSAVAEHLAALCRAGLVEVTPVGRKRICQLRRDPLSELVAWARAVGAADDQASGTEFIVEALIPATIQAERELAADPALVWAAVTTADLVAKWWITADVRPVVGHRFVLGRDNGAGSAPSCQVRTVDPPDHFAFLVEDRWTVAWHLAPADTGTRVRVEMSGFDLARPEDTETYLQLRHVWPHTLLPALQRLVEGPGRAVAGAADGHEGVQ